MATPRKKPEDLLVRSEAELAELRAQAKKLYFAYIQHNDIAKELSVTATTVAAWRKAEAWDVEREGIERGIIEDEFGARRLTLSRITKMSMENLERGLKRLSDRHEPPTLPEMEKLSLIVSNLDKILRLDMGRSTENVAVSSQIVHTVENIRERLAADPVLGIAISAATALPKPTPQPQYTPEAVFVELPE